jgi:hypothetical protein
MDLLKDLAIFDTLLVAFDDLVVPDADAGVAVLEELVGVVAEPLVGLHGDPLEVECVPRAIVGRLEVGREGLGQVHPRRDDVYLEVVEPE